MLLIASCQANKEDIDASKFDVRGAKLGMNKGEIEGIIPQLINQRDWGLGKGPVKYATCAGMGCGRIAKWYIEIRFTEKPFGSGAFDIFYNIKVDKKVSKNPTHFLNNFKPELVEKYGEPSIEISGNEYVSIWSNFSADEDRALLKSLQGGKLSGGNSVYRLVKENKIPKGKFLAALTNISNTDYIHIPRVYFYLVDTEPYFIEKKMEQENATETASEEGKKVKF
jgi:hypothetical protein|tara:strand:- start:464 stop:1138 length:675 start_codon:yes stop_codon:yes gene_type:complete